MLKPMPMQSFSSGIRALGRFSGENAAGISAGRKRSNQKCCNGVETIGSLPALREVVRGNRPQWGWTYGANEPDGS
jgi:hypothetical protein